MVSPELWLDVGAVLKETPEDGRQVCQVWLAKETEMPGVKKGNLGGNRLMEDSKTYPLKVSAG